MASGIKPAFDQVNLQQNLNHHYTAVLLYSKDLSSHVRNDTKQLHDAEKSRGLSTPSTARPHALPRLRSPTSRLLPNQGYIEAFHARALHSYFQAFRPDFIRCRAGEIQRRRGIQTSSNQHGNNADKERGKLYGDEGSI